MQKRYVISYAVAVLLGLTQAATQHANPAAIKAIDQIVNNQANLNLLGASQQATPVQSVQGLGSSIESFQPDVYLNSILGAQSSTTLTGASA